MEAAGGRVRFAQPEDHLAEKPTWDGGPFEPLPDEFFKIRSADASVTPFALRLNFACGDSCWPGFDNSDINGAEGVTHVDLRETPYPYEDESAEIILISHALFMAPSGQPHFPDLMPILREFHRILCLGGWLRINDHPVRCYREGEYVDPGESANEAQRGYPEHLRMPRDQLVGHLRTAGFSRIEDIPTGETGIPCDTQTREAIVANHGSHHSFTIEAQK